MIDNCSMFPDNLLEDGGAFEMANLVRQSSTLRVLDVRREQTCSCCSCCYSSSWPCSCHHLAAALPPLRPQHNIKHLINFCCVHRTGNKIGRAGLDALLQATKETSNPWLQHVRVDGNNDQLSAAQLGTVQDQIKIALAARNSNEL